MSYSAKRVHRFLREGFSSCPYSIRIRFLAPFTFKLWVWVPCHSYAGQALIYSELMEDCICSPTFIALDELVARVMEDAPRVFPCQTAAPGRVYACTETGVKIFDVVARMGHRTALPNFHRVFRFVSSDFIVQRWSRGGPFFPRVLVLPPSAFLFHAFENPWGGIVSRFTPSHLTSTRAKSWVRIQGTPVF